MSGTSSIWKGGVVRDREAWRRWNEEVIAEFRASEGKVGGQFEGAPMLLLHSVGAKSGLERIKSNDVSARRRPDDRDRVEGGQSW